MGTVNKLRWTVIGGGNGGQSLAGHLGILGHRVHLYDIFEKTIEAIGRQGGIHLDGVVEGFGPVALATTDMAAAVADSDIVVVVAPALAHRSIAEQCAPHLRDGQLLFIHPGATGGALEFRQVLDQCGCRAQLLLAEANSLIYACRSAAPGSASIFGIKKELMVAALPARDISRVLDLLRPTFPQLVAGRNVLETSLSNPNAMMHPAPTLLNTSMIESGRDWLYYWDGITPSIAALVESLDRERLALGKAYGLDLVNIRSWYRNTYQVEGETLCELVRSNPAYAEVAGQKSLHTRYLLEDIPMGLVPMLALGQAAGLALPTIDLIVRLGERLLDLDLVNRGRTLSALGLGRMDVATILHFLEDGR